VQLETGSPPGPAFDVALLPQWAQLEPFLMSSGDQFRPAPPPALDSAEYAAAFNEVKTLGVATGSARTPEQTQIARFWSDGSGTYTPAGHWNQIAMELAQAKGLSLSANARMLAELNLAMADAAIVAWDAKYSYETWRPVTAIQAAADDGNSQTAPDPSWQPLLITPPFPEYVSGHSTFSGAASTVLSAVFGAQTSFSTTGFGLPGVTRSFTSFDAAANEAGQSRIFGGIHFQFANQAGLAAGRALADFVLDRFAVEGDLAAPKILLEGPAEGLVTKQNFTINGRVLDNISG
jgi:membrane-associated phospholipid phosphatase